MRLYRYKDMSVSHGLDQTIHFVCIAIILLRLRQRVRDLVDESMQAFSEVEDCFCLSKVNKG
jgi:hypothetical protein